MEVAPSYPDRHPSLSVKVVLALAAVPVVLLAGFYPTIQDLAARWLKFDEAYGHGLLILAIVLYLLFTNRRALARNQPEPNLTAVIAVALLSFAWLVAHLASIAIIQQLLIPLILLSSWLAVAGGTITRHLAFPVLFLYFAIPVWDYLNGTLVDITVVVVQNLLRLWQISALTEGNVIHIPEGTIVIADGCSGLRYVITGSALSTLLAWMNYGRTGERLLVVAIGIALSLLANWVRVLSLVLIGHYTQMQSSLMKEHDHYGWLVFLVIFGPLLFFAKGSAVKERTLQQPKETQGAPGSRFFTALALTLLAMSIGPLIGSSQRSHANDERPALDWRPASSWSRVAPGLNKWIPTMPKPFRQHQYSVAGSDGRVNVFIYEYRKQTQTDKLLPYIDSIFDKRAWQQVASKRQHEQTGATHMDTQQLVIKSARGDLSHAIWYWYQVGDYTSASYATAKLQQIPALLAGDNAAFVFILESACEQPACDAAVKTLGAFMQQNDVAPKRPAQPERQ